MKQWLLLGLVATAALAGCMSDDTEETPADGGAVTWDYEPTPDPEPVVTVEAPTPAIRFVVLGDQGTGGEGQYAVAAAMESVCAQRGCDFALALGDNIYESGVDSVDDPQFTTKFEDPYANLTFPFYLALGNHDNSRDPVSQATGQDAGAGQWYASGNVEVAYTYKEGRPSDKWNLPARNYDFLASSDNSIASFIALDTNTLMYLGTGFDPLGGDVSVYGDQAAWVDDAFAAATGDWKIAFGHHPYISNGQHGNAGAYDGAYPTPLAGPYVKSFFEDHVCAKADIILAGHDHDLQWLRPVDACGKTQHIVSGAGGKTRSAGDEARNEVDFQQFDTLGFLYAEIQGDTFTGTFYDDAGTLLFTQTIERVA